MPCFSPLVAYQTADGEVVFVERLRKNVVRELSLPCGQCIGCRLERSRQWAMRCLHEASLHERKSFVTLTYDDLHLPKRGQLEYADFQKFMKRLRKQKGQARFYMCGEYGPLNWRPHFHACLFGVDFDDKEHWSTMASGAELYRSAELERLWPFGFASVGDVTFESAAYVARYCVQKVTGKNAKYHYARVDEEGEYQLNPEFNHMSLKPGIGAEFYKKWKSDMYPHDYVIVNGKEMKPPKYYDKMFKADDPDAFEEMQWMREMQGRGAWEDNIPARLMVKEQVTTARAGFLKRGMNDY